MGSEKRDEADPADMWSDAPPSGASGEVPIGGKAPPTAPIPPGERPSPDVMKSPMAYDMTNAPVVNPSRVSLRPPGISPMALTSEVASTIPEMELPPITSAFPEPAPLRRGERSPDAQTGAGREDRGARSEKRDEWASRSERARDALAGRILGGKYQLIRLLGQGGMGAVYKGEHLTLGVPIAVKIMHRHYAGMPEYVRRFRREAHASSLISHQTVVRVLDFGQEDDLLYLVMEFLDGRTLGAWIESLLPALPALSAVQAVLMDLCDAFEIAHSYGIVHRDLKPDNIFLTETGGRRVAKVVDFGLAHVDDASDAGPTLTREDIIAGTPSYMSPEQCRSLAVGPSADLYSLGCVLTMLLQGRPPFTGDSAVETISKHLFLPPPPLDRPPGSEPVPPLLERLRLDLLAKVKEKRPRDATEIRARLVEAMSAEQSALRLPTRKGDEPLGDRDHRAPSWDRPKSTVPPPPKDFTDWAAPVAAQAPRGFGLIRLSESAEGVGSMCVTGLAAQTLTATAVTDPAEVGRLGLSVVVIDAGADVAAARSWLERVAKAAPRARIVVCVADLTTEGMNSLVAAGAADVVRYPVTADTLGKKLDRVLRRKR